MRYGAPVLTALILVCACGSSSPVAVASPTPTPDPLSVARLEGVYDVTYTVTAMTGPGVEKVGDKTTRVWTATPRCTSGPCDTDIKAVTPPSTTVSDSLLTFAGGTYNLAPQSFIGGDCGSSTTQDSFDNVITFSVTTTAFAKVGKEVFASELTGNRHQVGTPRPRGISLGCKVGFTFDFSARVVRRA